MVCVAFVTGGIVPGRTRAQSDEPDAPAKGRSERPSGGSDVFDDTDGDTDARTPSRPTPAAPEPQPKPQREPEPAGSDGARGPVRVETPPADEAPAEPPAAPVERLPMPAKAAQAKALKLVKEVFAEEYRKKSAEDKLALAAQLLDQAGESGNDAAARYVMLREARDIAAAGGDLAAALSAGDEIAAAFAGVDSIAMKLETLAAASKKVTDPARAEAVVEGHLAVSAEMLSAAELDRAVKVVAQAEPMARKAKNADLTARLNGRKKELKELVSQFGAAVKAAKAKLAKSPADLAANATMGRFYCLAAGDWERGLLMLVKGNDAGLRKMAQADLAGADRPPAAMAGLGDAWWELGEKQSGLAKARVRGRAAHWYQQAVGELAGLQRTRVEKRLALVGPDAAGGASAAAPTDKALKMLNNLVRKLPAGARPRKGEPWDVAEVTQWLTPKVRSSPFDAVMKVASANASRFNGRDTFSASFEPVGPVKLDGVEYRLSVNLHEQTAVAPEMVRKLKRGTHVRVRGLVSSLSLGSSGGNEMDIKGVHFWVYLDRPNLTIVKPPPAAKAAPNSAMRLLERLARKLPDDLRPGRSSDWQTADANAWLEQQSQGIPLDHVARVSHVHDPAGDARSRSVYLDKIGPVKVANVDYSMDFVLHASDKEGVARLRWLPLGSQVRLRGIVKHVRASGWASAHRGTISSIDLQLEPEDGYMVTPVAEAKTNPH